MGILTKEPVNVNKDPYGFPKHGDSLCKVTLTEGIRTGRWPLSLDSGSDGTYAVSVQEFRSK